MGRAARATGPAREPALRRAGGDRARDRGRPPAVAAPARSAGAGGRTSDASARNRWRRQSRQRARAPRARGPSLPRLRRLPVGRRHNPCRRRAPRPGLLPGWLLGYAVASPLAVGCIAAWLALSRRWRGEWPLLPSRQQSSRWERGLFFVGLFFALLPLPVVFAPLQRVVPGLDGLRVPTRTYPFVSFALVFFAARGLDHLLARAQGARRRLMLAMVSILLVFELRDSMAWRRWLNRDEIPGIFQRIADVPDVRAVLHLPIPDYPLEAHYMYFSIAHWRPIVNGYSGCEPETYLEVKRRVQDELYDASTLDHLRRARRHPRRRAPVPVQDAARAQAAAALGAEWGPGPEPRTAPGVRRRSGSFLGAVAGAVSAVRAVRGAKIVNQKTVLESTVFWGRSGTPARDPRRSGAARDARRARACRRCCGGAP